MKSKLWLVLVAVVSAIVAFGGAAHASQSFGGRFDWSDASPVGDDVHVTLKVELINRSGAEVYDVTVTVEGFANPAGYGQIWVDDMASDAVVEASGSLVVPDTDYDSWDDGAHPQFRVDYTDANGNAAQEWIELRRLPLEDN